METGFLDDPGVKSYKRLHQGGGGGIDTNKLLEDDLAGEQSIVLQWEWIFERIWYAGHIFVVAASSVSMLACLTRQVLKPWPRLLYRSTFVGVTLTYTLSLLKTLNGAEPGFFSLLPLATFQYILLAVVWIFTIPHTIKLVPFALFSLLHVADTASEHHRTSKSRSRIAQSLSDNLAPKILKINGYLDIWLFVELLRDCLLVRPGAVISILVFGFFFRVKLMFSPASQDAAWHCYTVMDKYLSREDCPRRIRTLWIRLRNRFNSDELQASDLHKEDTERAIERANMFHWNK